MSWVISFTAMAGHHISGQSAPPVGIYLADYNPEANDGFGEAKFTWDIRAAMRFRTQVAAFQCWRQTSRVRPRRADGKPNRPLTAYTITVEEVKD